MIYKKSRVVFSNILFLLSRVEYNMDIIYVGRTTLTLKRYYLG
jgi:hypothetical protein